MPEPAAVAIFAADHGVHAQGVTPWPQEVTAQMVANFLAGGAVVNAFAAQAGAEVVVVDVGVATDLAQVPGLLPRKVGRGTGDFTTGPAMARDEAVAALGVGIEVARDLVAAGNRCLLTGDMGIANTTASAALICAFTGRDAAEVTGRGTGVDNETLARKYFSGTDPIGKQIMCGWDAEGEWWTIVGVVGDVRQDSPAAAPAPTIYTPVAQHPQTATQMQVVVRTRTDAGVMAAMLTQMLKQRFPQVAVKASTMRENVGESERAQHFRTLLFGSFAGVSILLAMTGMFGVTAYTVAQKRFEFALRFALGAQRGQVLGSVLGSALSVAMVGVVGGVMLGLGRALGETMAVTFVIGNSHSIAASLLSPATTISATIANEFQESDGVYRSSLLELGLLLFVITFFVLAAARIMLMRLERKAGA